MVLIQNKEGKGRANVESSLLPYYLLKCVLWTKGQGYKFSELKLDKNNVEATIDPHYTGRLELINRFAEKGFPMIYSCSRNGRDSTTFNISLNTDEKLQAGFQRQRFHSTINDVFATEGLSDSKTLSVNLSYETPHFVWRLLPKEFLDNIKGFDISGPAFKIGWPEKDYWGKPMQDRLRVNSSYSMFSRGLDDKEFGNFKEELIRTGLVEYSEKRANNSKTESIFSVDPKRIKQSKSIQVLEELVRETLPLKQGGRLSPKEMRTELKIEGKLSRDEFSLIDPLFDNSSSLYDSIKVSGKVSSGNISVCPYNNHTGDESYIQLKDTNFEEIERFLQTGRIKAFPVTLELGEKKFILNEKED